MGSSDQARSALVLKIDSPIIGYKVKTSTAGEEHCVSATPVVHMHETVARPERLIGATYKVKTPEHISEHSLYITINDIVLNEGTENEVRRPFEIFINSKSMEHFQWIVALTRILSAVFRKGGDINFLVEELRSVFDPKGGYWNKGKYIHSLIAEIGNVIETHLISIGMIDAPKMDPHQQSFIATKRAEFLGETPTSLNGTQASFPESATLCSKCHYKAVVRRDNCSCCLNCGESHC